MLLLCRNSLMPLSVILIALTVHFFDPSLNSRLEFNRNFIFDGEFHQLITGHFVHTNNMHLIFNLIGLCLLIALHGELYKHALFVCLLLFLCLFISFGILFFSIETIRYAGLSGVLHGLFAWGVILDILHKEKTGYLLFLGLIVKLGYEQIFGAGVLLTELIEAKVAIDAHLYGAIGGIVFATLQGNFNRWSKKV